MADLLLFIFLLNFSKLCISYVRIVNAKLMIVKIMFNDAEINEYRMIFLFLILTLN